MLGRRPGAAVHGLLGAAALALSVAAACSPLADLAATEPGTFGPSPARVAALLEDDRVRQALAEAQEVASSYPGPTADALLGRALWRNGRFVEAERRFRRAAEAGLGDGLAGLAAVRASLGDWQVAADLAGGALEAGGAAATAQSLLASHAWWSSDIEEASRRLSAWAEEADGRSAAVAGAMAAAVADLPSGPQAWSGEVSELALEALPDEGLAVRVGVGGVERPWTIDLSAPQSRISAELASAAGLTIRRTETAAAGSPPRLAAAQAAIREMRVGGALLTNAVVGVGPTPPGVDGVLAADLLVMARWSLLVAERRFVIGPPDRGTEIDALAAPAGASVLGWARARIVYRGVAAQLLLEPRVGGAIVAAAIHPGGPSLLDPESIALLEPDGDRPAVSVADEGRMVASLRLGAWGNDVAWQPRSLAPWAVDGGVAPTAVLGAEALGAVVLHWLPSRRQLRLDRRR